MTKRITITKNGTPLRAYGLHESTKAITEFKRLSNADPNYDIYGVLWATRSQRFTCNDYTIQVVADPAGSEKPRYIDMRNAHTISVLVHGKVHNTWPAEDIGKAVNNFIITAHERCGMRPDPWIVRQHLSRYGYRKYGDTLIRYDAKPEPKPEPEYVVRNKNLIVFRGEKEEAIDFYCKTAAHDPELEGAPDTDTVRNRLNRPAHGWCETPQGIRIEAAQPTDIFDSMPEWHGSATQSWLSYIHKREETDTMNKFTIDITTLTLVNGEKADDLTDDEIFDIIARAQQQLNSYKELDIQSKALSTKIEALESGIKALVEIVDGRHKES